MKRLDEPKNIAVKLGCQRHAMETKTILLIFIVKLSRPCHIPLNRIKQIQLTGPCYSRVVSNDMAIMFPDR